MELYYKIRDIITWENIPIDLTNMLSFGRNNYVFVLFHNQILNFLEGTGTPTS